MLWGGQQECGRRIFSIEEKHDTTSADVYVDLSETNRSIKA